jgi:hypothetical protein
VGRQSIRLRLSKHLGKGAREVLQSLTVADFTKFHNLSVKTPITGKPHLKAEPTMNDDRQKLHIVLQLVGKVDAKVGKVGW